MQYCFLLATGAVVVLIPTPVRSPVRVLRASVVGSGDGDAGGGDGLGVVGMVGGGVGFGAEVGFGCVALHRDVAELHCVSAAYAQALDGHWSQAHTVHLLHE